MGNDRILSPKTAAALGALGTLVWALGWYFFIANSFNAPSRGGGFYSDTLARSAIFQAAPVILLSGLMTVVVVNSVFRRQMFACLLAGILVAGMQIATVEIACTVFLARQ